MVMLTGMSHHDEGTILAGASPVFKHQALPPLNPSPAQTEYTDVRMWARNVAGRVQVTNLCLSDLTSCVVKEGHV